MIHITKIDTGFYGQDVYLILGDSGTDATKYINTKFKNVDKLEQDDKCRGFQWKTHYLKDKYFEKARFFVYIASSEIFEESTTLEHELLHLSWDILDHLNITLTPENHESQTYFFEHLLKECKKFIKKVKK